MWEVLFHDDTSARTITSMSNSSSLTIVSYGSMIVILNIIIIIIIFINVIIIIMNSKHRNFNSVSIDSFCHGMSFLLLLGSSSVCFAFGIIIHEYRCI